MAEEPKKPNLVQGREAYEAMKGKQKGGMPKSTNRALIECARIQDFGMPKGSVGKYPCPYCKKGYIQFSISASNGHIHAACENKCVVFMQ